ncbi:calcium-binding protein, partial [Dyella japonica]
AQQALLGDLLLAWAKTSPWWSDQGLTLHASGATESADSDNVILLTPGQAVSQATTTLDDEITRKIRIAQVLLGEVPTGDLWWGDANVSAYLKVYDTFATGAYQQLALQTRLKPYVDAIALRLDANGIALDISPVLNRLEQVSASHSAQAMVDFLDLVTFIPSLANDASIYVTCLPFLADQLDQSGQWDVVAATFSTNVMLGDFLLRIGTSGTDVLTSGAQKSILIGGDGNDTLKGGNGDDILLGGHGNDVINGGDGNDVMYGGDGDDTLDGGTGNNVLLGGAGNDVMKVAYNANNNVFVGGTGDDTMYGSYGSDTYVFNLGDGKDTIIETSTYAGAIDVLAFGEGIKAS